MLRLTRTGKIFVAVIVAMHFASITSQSGLLLWLVGLIAACLGVNAFAAIRSVREVRLQAPNRILIVEGAAPREPWQLVNTGQRPARLITVESADRVWLSVAEVPAGQTVAALPRDVFSARGVYALADAWVVSLYPFGLVKAMREIESPGEVLVYPQLRAVPAPEVRGLDPMPGGRHAGPGRIASGETFAGVRPLQSGDSFKQIHWKSSAKGGGLMIKTFEEELAGRAALLVFCKQPGPVAEACIRAAGSIAAAGIEAGHQIDFVNLNEGRRVRTPPFGDATRLFEELARFDPSAGAPTAVSLAAAIDSVPSRCAIHFMVTDLMPDLSRQIESLQSLARLVVLHLPEGVAAPASPVVHRYPMP